MPEISELVPLLRNAEQVLASDGNWRQAEWIVNVFDTFSLGDPAAMVEPVRNCGGLGGVWEWRDHYKDHGLIAQVDEVLDDAYVP